MSGNFGSIGSNLSLAGGQSVRRNAGDTAFEAYTPGSGGGGVFMENDQIQTPNKTKNIAQAAIFFPVVAPASGNLTKMYYAIETVSGTPTIEVGIYSSNAGGDAPASKLVSATDAPTSTGIKAVTITSTAVTKGTLYWLAFLIQTESNTSAIYKAQLYPSNCSKDQTGQASLPTSPSPTTGNQNVWIAASD